MTARMTTRGVNRAALGGAAPKVRRKSPAVPTPTRVGWLLMLTVPCRVLSESNRRGHWSKAYARSVDQRAAVNVAWLASPVQRNLDWSCQLPLAVTLIHTGPRMDDDNLARAFKAVRDAVAALIEVDDGDPRVSWRYAQQAGTPGVAVTIESREV